MDKSKLKIKMSNEGLVVYEPEKPMTIRLDKKETNDMLKKEINFSKYDEICEIAHLEISNTCFPAGTLIATPDKDITIENLKIGDQCLVYDDGIKPGKVKATSKRKYYGDLIEICLLNNKIIQVTPNHKIYTNNRGWIKAKDLVINDELADMQNLQGEIPQ